MSQLLAQTQPTFFSPHLTLFLQICAAIAGVGVAVRTIYSFYCFVHSGYERRKEKVNKAFGLLGAILFEGFKPVVLCFMAFGFRRSDIAFYQRFYWFSLGLFALLISATIWFDWMRRHNRRLEKMLAAVQNLHTTNKHALGLTKELIDAMENASMWKLDQEKEVRKVIKILMSHLEGLAGVTDVFFAYITEERKITLGALTKVVAFLIYLWLALYIALVK